MNEREILFQALTEWEKNYWDSISDEDNALAFKMIENAKYHLTEREIFSKVQKEYLIEDAETQVDSYLEQRNIDPNMFKGKFDYSKLADMFMEEQDCNIADNVVWEYVIKKYIKET